RSPARRKKPPRCSASTSPTPGRCSRSTSKKRAESRIRNSLDNSNHWWSDDRVTRDEASSVRAAVRAAVSDRILAVLDDDPTGSQSVRGVQVVTALDEDAYTAAISADSAATFVLTNTRGLHEENAAELTRRIATQLIAVAARAGRDLDLVSRSDST